MKTSRLNRKNRILNVTSGFRKMQHHSCRKLIVQMNAMLSWKMRLNFKSHHCSKVAFCSICYHKCYERNKFDIL
jgi:hypothetical protein